MSSQHIGASNSASLRPRNRRLFSDENGSDVPDRIKSSSRPDDGFSGTPFPTVRAPSSIPSAHPSRTNSRQRPTQRPLQRPQNASRTWGGLASSTVASNPLSTPSYWETSWSSIQGIASTLLGSDISGTQRSGKGSTKKNTSNRSQFSISTPAEWGPAVAEQTLAYGSQEDRLAEVQAKKRERLLLANGHTTADSLGHHKRRTSVDQDASGSSRGDLSDTRVYLHHVQKGDSLAGLSVRYNCPQSVIQKQNRLWPNDSIQIRSIAYIPVDSCGVRGRKIPTPKPSKTILSGDSAQANSDWAIPSSPIAPSTAPSLALNSAPSPDGDTPHIHDSWVSLDHISEPVEVARLSRRHAGFFPPRRRKSIVFSDITPPVSPTQSPPTLSPNIRGRHLSPATRPHRSASNTSSSAAHFLKHLRGPGGVGSLDVKSRSPGPSKDRLNEIFGPHLPDMAAPRESFDSVRSGSTATTGLGELGGKVEGWVRKMSLPKKHEKGPSGGELIELVDSWNMGTLGESAESEPNLAGNVGSTSKAGEPDAGDDEARMLEERFPVRGRVFEGHKRR